MKISDIGFRCQNPSCSLPNGFIQRQGKEIPLLEKIGLRQPPKKIVHCGIETNKRICPVCKNEFPSGVDDLSDLSLAIIGPKGSGKSHYIAMLIKWIEDMGGEEVFDWYLQARNDETIDRFKNEFRHPLFDEQMTIATTQKNTKPPLIYTLHFGSGYFSKKLLLVFFDTAGENLANSNDLTTIDRYIYNASGIICLLDPLQLPIIRELLKAKYGDGIEKSLPQVADDTVEIINRVATRISNNSKDANRKIDIPLAIAFSKMDFLAGLDEETCQQVYDTIFAETHHKKGFCEEEFMSIDGIMRAWVNNVAPNQAILNASRQFAKNAFFGFSALGCNPDETNHLNRYPRSFRVEDPFLWLLHQRGLVKQVKTAPGGIASTLL